MQFGSWRRVRPVDWSAESGRGGSERYTPAIATPPVASAASRRYTIAIIGAIGGALGRAREEPRDANKIRRRPRPDNAAPRYYSALAELLLCP